jgi:hypothetical protein
MLIERYQSMKKSMATTKVLINNLTGKIKVISVYGQATYRFRHGISPDRRLKNSLSLLRMLEKLKHGRNVLSRATRQAIQLKIKAAGNCH